MELVERDERGAEESRERLGLVQRGGRRSGVLGTAKESHPIHQTHLLHLWCHPDPDHIPASCNDEDTFHCTHCLVMCRSDHVTSFLGDTRNLSPHHVTLLSCHVTSFLDDTRDLTPHHVILLSYQLFHYAQVIRDPIFSCHVIFH